MTSALALSACLDRLIVGGLWTAAVIVSAALAVAVGHSLSRTA